MATDSFAATLASSTPQRLSDAADDALQRCRAGIARLGSDELADVDLLETYDEAIAALIDTADVAELVAKTHPDAAMRSAGEQAMQRLYEQHHALTLDRAVYEALASVDVDDLDEPTRHW